MQGHMHGLLKHLQVSIEALLIVKGNYWSGTSAAGSQGVAC